MFRFLLLFLLLVAGLNPGLAQDCPRIWRSGDTLYTDPAAQIQWFRGDTPLPGENRSWLVPPRSEQALYRVEVRGGFSPVFPFQVSASEQYELAGVVIDAAHRPVSGATVRRGSATATTDAVGRFVLRVNERRPAPRIPVVLVVEKDGYWRNTTRQYLSPFNRTETLVRLQPLTVTNRVDAREGGELGFNGFSMRLPAEGVQTANGRPYNGTILLSVEGALPSDPDFGLRMPGGDFTGIDESGNEVRLFSYGYLSVIMRTETGERLDLRPGFEANLRFRLSTETARRAPDSVPLWNFDDVSGTWQPEGWAYRRGNTLDGSVRHFSSWNVDLPLPGRGAGLVRGRLLGCTNQPVSGAWVRVGQRQLLTDSLGAYWSWVPNDIPFNVVTQRDSFTNQQVAAFQELTLPDFRGSNFGGLARWNAQSDVLEVELWGATPAGGRISVDGGQTWTTNRRFVNLTAPPAVVLVDSICQFPLRVAVPPPVTDCQRVELFRLTDYPVADNLSDAWSTPTTYRLHLTGPQFGGRWDLVLPLPCLHELSIAEAGLTDVPEEIIELSVLGRLHLVNNNLTTLPQNLWNLSELEELDLSGNQLTALPTEVAQLSSLKDLYLMNNQLTSLPAEISQLGNLLGMHLSGNPIATWPAPLLNMPNLRSLYLNSASLSVLPLDIDRMSGLREIDISSNAITTLPAAFTNLVQLTWVEMSNNNLMTLPASIGSLSALRFFRFASNQLTQLPASFTDLSSLDLIEAQGNNLTELPIDFGRLTGLEYIDLSNNLLTALPASFSDLSNLGELRLSGNSLTSLPPAICDLANLYELRLNNNQLTGLPPEIANLADTLRKLELVGNPIPVPDRPAIEAMLPNTQIRWD